MIAVVLVAAALLWMLVFFSRQAASRHQAAALDGVVEKKEILTRESRFGTHLTYVLIIRDESGELVRFRVPRTMYERTVVGMPARKKAGEPLPVIGER
ncbi:MAG: hypothetical protein QOH06_3253 [Acidobacteriota bacterium]|nr:hypothetical protein [Acidobacteriota bacterium]